MPERLKSTDMTGSIIVLNQPLTLAKDARKTAVQLGARLDKPTMLSTGKETLFDVWALKAAKNGKYKFAVDPKDLPTTARIYQIVRNNSPAELEFRPISIPVAENLEAQGRGDEVLVVHKSAAVNAGEQVPEKRPVTLSFNSKKRCFQVHDRPYHLVKVPLTAIGIETMLRRAEAEPCST